MSIVYQKMFSSRRELTDYENNLKDDITVVIPTLNEELAIGNVIESVLLEGYSKILVVDGNSSDNTVRVARTYGVDVIQQHGSGKTGALKTAIENVKTPYMIVMDGDLTYDPKDIEKFIPHIKNYNEIIGARQKGRENISWFNRVGKLLINITFNLLFGTNLSDVCSGMYSLKTEFAKGLRLDTKGFDVEVEIASQAALSNKITEVMINYYSRIGKRKLHPVKDGLIIFKTIIKLARIYNPVFLYSGIATMTIIPGLIILFFSALQGLLGGWNEGFILFGILLLLFGIQFLSIGILSLQQKRMEQRILQKISKEI